jgi:cell division protein FtsQ
MNAVAAPTDRRFRRAHVKPARKRRWRDIARLVAIYTLVLTAIVVAAYRGGEVLARARVLQIDRLVVTGNRQVPAASVLEAVDGLRGQNLILTDLDVWRERLLRSPWLRDAALRRSLPSTVEIAVQERTPTMLVRIEGRLFLADEQGIVIDEYGPAYSSFDLPIVDGIRLAQPGPGASLDPARTRLAVRAIAALRGAPDLMQRLSQVDVTDAHNARVRLAGDTAVLHLGEDQFQQRLESYLQLAETLRASVADIEYVDLRFGDRVFVKPMSATRGADPRAASLSERSRR